jgi:L-fucose isomerase
MAAKMAKHRGGISTMSAKRLSDKQPALPHQPAIGVFATGDPRIAEADRTRCVNIVEMAAKILAKRMKMPDGSAVKVVYSPILVDGEKQADMVARQFEAEGVDVLVCVPDTWAFPQLSLISLLSQFPPDTPINLTCGNSGPRPGVVFTHASSGAISQYGKLVHINVGTWPDTGMKPAMTEATADALVDWAYAAVTRVGLKGRRVVVLGHDSMGMETALAHVIPTRNIFGLEVTRLDMKLLADMLNRKAYDARELKQLRAWCDRLVGKRIELRDEADSERFDQSLAMYLITRDLMADLNAVGGGFMSQLEWGSDSRGIPLPVADVMESLFNSTFDHRGKKEPIPYATEADVQGLLTMLFFTWLSAGNPPLFMDFRKVWEPWEINAKAKELGLAKVEPNAVWRKKGLVDGDNSGSASFDWAARPGASVKEIMAGVRFPLADEFYFPGLGNSVNFVSPAGIDGIAGRLSYSSRSDIFSLVWDEATTESLPDALAQAVCNASTPTWPHTFVVPKYASMGEYKQFTPANHFHMTWGLAPARLEYWMDLANVLSVTPWQARPSYIEGTDRPTPLLYLANGGEAAMKLALARR